MVTNRQHVWRRQGDAAFAKQNAQGAGSPFTGACMARVNIGKGLLSVCAFLCISAPAELWAAADAPVPAATSFAYSVSHPVTPLPPSVIERIDQHRRRAIPMRPTPSTRRTSSAWMSGSARRARCRAASMCNAVVSVARANDLPIPFFANLIWQESNFDVKSISRAGALGVAQFMPQTANEHGLINPFEPIHALHAAGKIPAPAAGAVRQSRAWRRRPTTPVPGG